MSKYICQTCGKDFATHRAHNAHQVAHKSSPRYTVSRQTKTVVIHTCKSCGNQFPHSYGSYNKFCSLQCFADYKWKNESIPLILAGKGGNYKRYIVETRGEECERCGQGPIWNNEPLTLQLDHIDGDSDNNALDNLRLLCPNCHTQTETYGNAGKGSRYKKKAKRNLYLQEYKKNGRVAQR